MDAFQEDVLTAIANDYEEIEQILVDLRGWHPRANIEEQEVVAALKLLVEAGLASAFKLSTTQPAEMVEFQAARARGLYFYITPKGKLALAN